MFEKTNQTETNTTEVEAAFESGLDADAAADAPSEAEAQEVQAPPAEQKYTVKYNGKEVDLTLDELKTRAQMGMNYDHVKAENDRIKNSQLYKTLYGMAQREGVSLEEYGKRIAAQSRQARIDRLEKSGMQPEAAKRYLDMETQMETAKAEAARKQPYLDFVRKFPDVRPEEISDAVWERFHETGSLIGAYTEAENAKLRAQIKTMQQNEENAQRAIGSLANDRAAAHTDAFLEGLLGG